MCSSCRALVIVLQPLTLLIPFLLVVILDGLRGLRETWPIALVVTIVFSGIQAAVLWFLGPPELADLAAGLGAMVAIFALCRVWSPPKRVFREADAPPEPVRTAAPSLKEVGVAWSPLLLPLAGHPAVVDPAGEGAVLRGSALLLDARDRHPGGLRGASPRPREPS